MANEGRGRGRSRGATRHPDTRTVRSDRLEVRLPGESQPRAAGDAHAAVGGTYPTAGGRYPVPPMQDLPEVKPLRAVLGPGVIAAGVGLASGEFVLWPYLSANIGLAFLWAMLVGVTLQYFVNMEIERYTLATGETALAGFSRLWRHWGLAFAVMAVLANMWPGWATSSATVLTYVAGGGDVVWISIAELAVIGLVLTISPVVYKSVEMVQFAKVGLVIVFMVIAVFLVVTGDAAKEAGKVVTEFGQFPSGIGVAVLLSALVFAGGGGAQNLVGSNWIRDKGLGMGGRMPRLVSPITGDDEAKPGTGMLLNTDAEGMRRWKGWWRVANTEQLVSFVAITVLTITVTSLLAYSTVFGREGLSSSGVGFLQVEGDVLNDRHGWFGDFFWVVGAVSLFAAALGILDYVGRLVADVLKTSYCPDSRQWTESRIYAAVVWGMIVFGSVVLLVGVDQPLALLVISACLGGFMMFVYSGLLIMLQRRALPKAVRPAPYRVGILGLCVLIFGVFSAVTIVDQLQSKVF